MEKAERIQILARLGFSSYSEYLRGQLDGLDVGESNNINLFQQPARNARSCLRAVASQSKRRFRTVTNNANVMTVIRVE